jgi:membrane protease YdiL (CAAX protease family)
MTGRNDRHALRGRLEAGTLDWRAPALMLPARSACAVAAQGLAALLFWRRGSATPWLDAAPWLPVYGTLIDAGCLTLLWRLTRLEGIGLADLLGFERGRLASDALLGVALIPVSLAFIFAGIRAAGWLVYGRSGAPYLYGPLPMPAALYGLVIWPFVWGVTEQMTYNGYLAPRFQVLFRRTAPAVACVAIVWSFQHVVMPLTFDPKFMLFRMLSLLPFSVFVTLAYLRLRRLVPFALAHGVMDGAGVLVGVVLPLVRS